MEITATKLVVVEKAWTGVIQYKAVFVREVGEATSVTEILMSVKKLQPYVAVTKYARTWKGLMLVIAGKASKRRAATVLVSCFIRLLSFGDSSLRLNFTKAKNIKGRICKDWK